MKSLGTLSVVVEFEQLERIEKEILEKQKELIEAKTQNLKSIENSEKLYADALKAFRGYSGHGDEVDDA